MKYDFQEVKKPRPCSIDNDNDMESNSDYSGQYNSILTQKAPLI